MLKDNCKNGVTNINKLRVSEDYDRAMDQDLDYKITSWKK